MFQIFNWGRHYDRVDIPNHGLATDSHDILLKSASQATDVCPLVFILSACDGGAKLYIEAQMILPMTWSH